MSISSCVRCGSDFTQPIPPVAYCGACRAYFNEKREAKEAGTRGGTGNVKTHATPAGLRGVDYPVSILVGGFKACGLCGSRDLEEEYGHCCYGCGTFQRCRACLGVLNFQADSGK